MHIDILEEDFLNLNEPHDDKIYFIQDVNPININDLYVEQLEEETDDYVIGQAMELLRNPIIQ